MDGWMEIVFLIKKRRVAPLRGRTADLSVPVSYEYIMRRSRNLSFS
jgi:hypothetical protein